MTSVKDHIDLDKLIVGRAPPIIDLKSRISQLADFDVSVLITGESGTGKELVAKAIHQSSYRSSSPFVALNCGAVPEHLLESELFGHKKGAFTDAHADKNGLFLVANGGTLFLDEIAELPLASQVKLLRALEEKEIRRVGDNVSIKVDVRIISATNRELYKDVADGRFRSDLLHRINVVTLYTPPLRERLEDIELLCSHIIKRLNRKLSLKVSGLSAESLGLFKSYSWPGNVRELENCLEMAMVLSKGEVIERQMLPERIRKVAHLKRDILDVSEANGSLSIKDRVRELEIQLIKRALKKTNGNRTHAARLLEISLRSLIYKLKEYSIS